MNWLVRIILGLIFLVFSGCSESSKLSGTATYDGTPIDDGWISLLPVGVQGPQCGGKITHGAFVVEGVQPGTYQAQIVGVKPVKFVASTEEMQKMSEEMGTKARRADVVFAADNVPEEAIGNYEEIEIAAGDQQRDFHLLPPEKNN